MKKIFCMLSMLTALTLQAQSLNVQPILTPESGSYNDRVVVSCSFPEGCSGGVYWYNGGEIKRLTYIGPISVEYSADLSVAGVNSEGRIITDVVTQHYEIEHVTPPFAQVSPKEGRRDSSFYVTRIDWKNVTTSSTDLSAYKEGGSKYGTPVVWLTNSSGKTVAQNDYNGVWSAGWNAYKIYLYKNYDQTAEGKYTLHVAGGIFVLDGKVYEDELTFHYEKGKGMKAPIFEKESGEYYDSLQVSIRYPSDGSALFPCYSIDGGEAQVYTAPFTIYKSCSIEAYGLDAGYNMTESAKVTYTIKSSETRKDKLPTPVITRSSNTITISAAEGATVKYWLNDHMQSAVIYTKPFDVHENGRVSAVAYTSTALSPTANLMIEDFVVDRGDYGDQEILTPTNLPELYVSTMSVNGRFAVGHVGCGTSSMGYLWDIVANNFQYVPTIFANQLKYVSDNGAAYGWTATTTEISEDTGEDCILWGTYVDGEWIPQPEDMKVNGMSADGCLFGSHANRPALYNVATGIFTYYTGTGEICAVCGKDLVAGYVLVGGKQVPAIWNSEQEQVLLSDKVSGEMSVTFLSENGEWGVIGDSYRLHLSDMQVEKMTTTAFLHPNERRPEVVMSIANDGTVFGTFDESLLSPDKGVALVYSKDGRWRSAADWLLDEKGYKVNNYSLTSMRAVSGDHNLLLMHVFPKLLSTGETFTHGMALRLNVQIAHLSPVSVRAVQLVGSEVVKLTWEAPISGKEDIASYSIYRDGVHLATVSTEVCQYFDETVSKGNTYVYTIKANYKDGKVSEASYESKVKVSIEHHLPVVELEARRMGVNDILVSWKNPSASIPKCQYFSEGKAWQAFGTRQMDAEFAIRIPASDLAIYKKEKIRTFQFLPTAAQTSFELRLYHGIAGTDSYENEPFYTQAIDPESLEYGVVNTILLNAPQSIKEGCDLYVGLFAEVVNSNNMLGVQFEGFRQGYTDLCRIDGVHKTFVSIAAESKDGTVQIVNPLGIGICSEEQLNGSIIESYELRDNGKKLTSTKDMRYTIVSAEEGKHEIEVIATYRDKVDSEPVKKVIDLEYKADAYIAVKPNVYVEDNNVSLRWSHPLNDDRTEIHWGDLQPRRGLELNGIFEAIAAECIYPSELTAPYEGDYDIVALYYYPDAEAEFTVSLQDGFDKTLFEREIKQPVLHSVNYVMLPSPIAVDPVCEYTMRIDMWDVEQGTAPLAYESSETWRNDFSNILYVDDDRRTLQSVVEVGERPSWFMGMVVTKRDAQPMPMKGYNVYVDDKLLTSSPISGESYEVGYLSDGRHTTHVDVVYSDKVTTVGKSITFFVGERQGIEETTSETEMSGRCYDLLGRVVENVDLPHGVYILNGEKIIK